MNNESLGPSTSYDGNRNVIWKCREWLGDEAGIPRADLAQGMRLDAGNRQKYKHVKTLLQLVSEADYEETSVTSRLRYGHNSHS